MASSQMQEAPEEELLLYLKTDEATGLFSVVSG